MRPSIEKKVLLVLDGHSTHTKSIAAISLAAENGVILLQLPAHCTHRLQPLDVSFFKPLSTAYNDEIRAWLRKNPGQIITTLQFAGIFSAAYKKTTNYDNAANGFSSTGIWPIDKDVFLETDFAKTAMEHPVPSELSVSLQEILPVPEIPQVPSPKYSQAVELTSPIYISGLQEKLQLKAEKEQEKKERLEARESKRRIAAAIKMAKSVQREEKKKERERKLAANKFATQNRKKKVAKRNGMYFPSLSSLQSIMS